MLLLISTSIQTKNNSPAAQEKCITRLLLYHFGVNLPVMIFSYPVFKYMGMQSSLPLPSWYFQVLYALKLFSFRYQRIRYNFWCRFLSIPLRTWMNFIFCEGYLAWSYFWFCRKVVLSQIIFYFILEDFVFYWGHRILHTKWLYKHVHSVHHE